MATLLGSLLVSLGLESGQFRSGLSVSEKQFRRATRQMQQDAQQASDRIIRGFRTIAAATAGIFTGKELVGLLDGFTRLQNNLKIAGVAGENLKSVQDRLFASAQKYGVELEGLSKLFSSLSQSSKELGATQEQIFTLTNSVSAALKVSGVSATEASGALLQLSQTLRGGKVQAEEYNSLIDGLFPLLEAAAAGSDRWRGSVAKLTADVKAGKVTSQEFFQAILAGSQVLEGKAEKATLTLSSGFTKLKNALTVYFGEADKARGISAALGEVLAFLARNLDTLVKSIIAVSTALGVGFVVNAIRARVAAAALAAASVNAAGALGTLGVMANRAGLAISTAFGGRAGASILAVAAAFAYLATRENTATEAAERYRETISRAEQAKANAIELARKLAAATGEERKQTEAAIASALKKARADQIAALAAVKRAQAELVLAQAAAARVERSEAANTTGRGSAELGIVRGETQRSLRLRTGELRGATDALKILNDTVKALADPLSVPPLPGLGSVTAGDDKGKKSKGTSGPSASDIAQRFNDELASLAQQALSAQGAQARSAEERAELELRSVELARIRTEAGIKHDKDYTSAQKEQLLHQLEVTAEEERRAINFAKQAQLEDESRQLAEDVFRSQSDALQIQYDLADSQAERKRIALEQLELEQRHQRALLESTIASETVAEAEKERARLLLKALDDSAAAQRQRVSRGNETPAERFQRELNPSAQAVNEAIDEIKIDGLNALNDGLVDATVNFKSLGDVARGVLRQILGDLLQLQIRQAIIKPLAGALGLGGGGGGGGFLGGLLSIGGALAGGLGGASAGGGIASAGGSLLKGASLLKGFAGGTSFAPGGLAIVGERGPELVNLRRGSQVIPNDELKGLARNDNTVNVTLNMQASGNPRADRESASQAASAIRARLTPVRGM